MDHFLGRNDEQMQCRGILHIVEAGDTLYKIGKKYGVPVSRVIYANPYVNVYNLQIGDEICVPVMTPRRLSGENNMPQRMGQNRMEPDRRNRMGERSVPMRQNRTGERMVPEQMNDAENSRMPMRENNRENNMPDSGTPVRERNMPMRENNMPDSGMPMRQNRWMGSGMPAPENPMDESRRPVRRDRMEESEMPVQKRDMGRYGVPAADDRENGMRSTARGNRMGFPVPPLEETAANAGYETENAVYMGNRMASAEENNRRSMREAAEKTEKDQSMRNQPDTDNTQEKTGSGRREDQQRPTESVQSGSDQVSGMRLDTEGQELAECRETAERNHTDRKYTPAAESCMEREESCSARSTSGTLPWNNTEVTEQRMNDYLQKVPGQTTEMR